MPSHSIVSNSSPAVNPFESKRSIAGATILLWDSGGLYYARLEGYHAAYQFYTCESRAVWLTKITWLLAWILGLSQ